MKLLKKPLHALTAMVALAGLTHASDYSTWARFRTVTLNTSNLGLSGSVTKFPMPIRFKASVQKDLLDSAATQVQATGSDIRVTKADGTTDVPFEIEYIKTGTGGALHLWVLVDSVAANNPNAATFRVYWGKTGQTSLSAPGNVFPTSAGYQVVFHMNDTGATITNAANSALNGTATGTTTTAGQTGGTGFVSPKSGSVVRAFGNSTGGAAEGTAAANYITVTPPTGNALRNYSGPLTMEGWVYASITQNGNTSQGTKTIIAQGNGSAGGKAWFARTANADGSTGQNHYSAGGPLDLRGPIAPFQEQNHWQYVVAVWNGTQYSIYRQRESDPWNNATVSGPTGMTTDSATYKVRNGTAPIASTTPWYIGGVNDTVAAQVAGGWQGWMEEVRISTVARDSNYVKLNFATFRSDTVAGAVYPISVSATESQAALGSYAAWTGHRSIVLNTTAAGANVATNVTNFPVLVRLGSAEAAIIAAAKANGADLRFSKADNATALPYQVESWSPTAAAIWVKVDTVKGNNATQTIRMHWGNSAATAQSSGPAVFDSTNGFKAVFHMNEADSTNIQSSASDTLTGINTSTKTTAGLAGTARNFGAANASNTSSLTDKAYILLGAPTALNFTGRITMSAWIRYTNIVGTSGALYYRTIINRDGTTPSAETFLRIGLSSGTSLAQSPYSTGKYTGSADIVAQSPNPASSYNDSLQWTHLTGAYDSTSTTNRIWRLYRNGVQIGTSADNATAALTGVAGANGWRLGRGAGTNNQRWFAGDMDEVRIESVTRDSNWIKLSYQNQQPINTLADIGLPVFTVPGQPTGVTAVADTAAARISWTAPANDGGKAILSYKAMVFGDTSLFCETTTGTNCKITGLTAGTSYNVVVRATNAVGAGPNSVTSNAVVPVSPVAPTAPLNPSATVAGSDAVTIKWSAPAYNGGSPITGYTVTATPGGLTCTTTGDTTCQVTGLTQNTQYSFVVQANNVTAVLGAASVAVTAKTTGIIPGSFVISMNRARDPYTYRLPQASVEATQKLSMTISDVKGNQIWTSTINPASSHVSSLTWNGTTSNGQAVAPGLYVVRIKAIVNGAKVEEIHSGIKH